MGDRPDYTGSVVIEGTVTVSGIVSITGTVTISGNVNVTNSVINIQGVAGGTAVTISGAVTVSSGTISITGTVTITGNVNITNSVLYIATSGGTNIIIDKLVQDAVTPRTEVVYQRWPTDNLDEEWGTVWAVGVYLIAQGARSFIKTIGVYGRVSSGSGTITAWFSPTIRSMPVFSKTSGSITNTTNAIIEWNVNEYWPYDTLFVYFTKSGTNVICRSKDADPTSQCYLRAGDVSVNWTVKTHQLLVRIATYSLPVGTLPIGGTVTNIAIPNTAAKISSGSVSLPNNVETTVIPETFGAGHIEMIFTDSADNRTFWYVYCDGAKALDGESFGAYSVSPLGLNAMGFGNATPKITLCKYTATIPGQNNILISIRFEFLKSFRITAKISGATDTVQCQVVYTLIK